MRKILLLSDSSRLNTSVLDFACYVSRLTNSKLIGIFLEDELAVPAEAGELVQAISEDASAGPAPKADLQMWESNINLFRDACASRGCNCSVHRNWGVPELEVLSESRFADLMIVDPEMTFNERTEGAPSRFVKDLLSKSECPVILAPSSFEGIDEIIFAYDGSPSSVFALKQFTYLFPQYSDKKITLLEASEKDSYSVTEKEKVRELVQMHYSTIGFKVMKGRAESELLACLLEKKNTFVIMGSYGRSTFSDFLRPSTADHIIQTVNLPIFITHR